MIRKKAIYLFTLFFFMLLPLTGCSLSSELTNSEKNSDHFTIGNSLTIDNIENRFTLLDKKDTLASDGIYYASWGIGNLGESKEKEDTTVEYDAHLYLLLFEGQNEKEAQNKKDSWLFSAKEAYDIIKEEEMDCKEQPYSIVSYNCKNENNSYTKGISAFSISGNHSICIELTSREIFEENLKETLTYFLNHCSFQND